MEAEARRYSKLATNRSRAWRAAMMGAAAVALLVLGFATRGALLEATVRLARMRPWGASVVPVFVLWTLAAALAWRAVMMGSDKHQPSLLHLLRIRIQAQSVNLVLPAFGLGGDVLRASVLAGTSKRVSESTASVVLDTAASIVACLVFAGLGTLVGWDVMRCALPLRGLAVVGPLAIAAVVWFAPSIFPRLASWRWLLRWRQPLQSTALAIQHGYGHGYGRAVAWHMVERLLIVGEIAIFVRALGVDLSLLDTVFATAMMTTFSSVMFFVPGQAVAADGGLALGLVWAGAPWEVGLAVALARRLRQLLVGLVGLLLSFAALAKRTPQARADQRCKEAS